MKLSKTSAQAALAVGYLAERRDEGPIQARQVGEYLGVPTDSALKILQALARRQVIQSRLGRGGGYRLETTPEDVSLLAVVEAVEGPIIGEINVHAAGETQADAVEVLQNIYDRAAAFLRNELARHSVAAVQPAMVAEVSTHPMRTALNSRSVFHGPLATAEPLPGVA